MIRFTNITKKYGKQTIIKDMNFNVEKGSFVCIIGRSGSGKTTMLKMINRLIEPTSGEIYINDGNIANENIIKLRRNIGYVIQQTGLFVNMTVKENIEIIAKLEKISPDLINARTDELMEMVGLKKDLLKRFPDELSGGQQQRVGIARAFALDPDLILMDEPFSALDPMTRIDLQEYVSSICKEYKKTIVFVTHDMDEALKIADYVCIIDKGKIIQYDTPENIIKNPTNEYVTNFIGKNRVWSSPEFLTASDIMITEPVIAATTTSVKKCIAKMKTLRVDNLLITNQGKLQGLVTARRLMQYADSPVPVSEIMLTDFVKTLADGRVLDILKIVDENDVSCVPVVDEDNNLLGLVTRGTLLTLLLNQNG